MLFLFSDIGESDAPTRIRVGSHFDMARLLAPAGEAGMSLLVLDQIGAERPQALATGEAGTVYLCHPFLVHAAQMHRGTVPRFMAQPPLTPAEPFRLDREDGLFAGGDRHSAGVAEAVTKASPSGRHFRFGRPLSPRRLAHHRRLPGQRNRGRHQITSACAARSPPPDRGRLPRCKGRRRWPLTRSRAGAP
jgi:hypothetical protein